MTKDRHPSHTWSPFGPTQVCVVCWCIEHDEKAFRACVAPTGVSKPSAKAGKSAVFWLLWWML